MSGRLPLLSKPAPALLFLLATVLVASAATRALVRSHRDRSHLVTGEAVWIWRSRDIPEPAPIRFYAAREFFLESVPPAAAAKIFVDRGFVFFVNGSRVGTGQQRPGDALSVFDVAPLLRPGANRIVIQAESPTGVGGILFSLDLGEKRKNAIVSDGTWRVALSEPVLRGGGGAPAAVWGSPPMYPWGYPPLPGDRGWALHARSDSDAQARFGRAPNAERGAPARWRSRSAR